MVAMGYHQLEGVSYLINVASTTSAISNRLVVDMAFKLGWDLRGT